MKCRWRSSRLGQPNTDRGNLQIWHQYPLPLPAFTYPPIFSCPRDRSWRADRWPCRRIEPLPDSAHAAPSAVAGVSR
jgi:hypothetical protein